MKQWVNKISAALLSSSIATTAYAGPNHDEIEKFFYGSTSHTPPTELTKAQEFNRHVRDNYNWGAHVLSFDREQAVKQAPDVKSEDFRREIKKQFIMSSAHTENIPYDAAKIEIEQNEKDSPNFKKWLDDVSEKVAKNKPNAQRFDSRECLIIPGEGTIRDMFAKSYFPNNPESVFIDSNLSPFIERQSTNIHEYAHCSDENLNASEGYPSYLAESYADVRLSLEMIHSGSDMQDIKPLMLTRTMDTVYKQTMSHFTTPSLQKIEDLDFETIRQMKLEDLSKYAEQFLYEEGNHLSETEFNEMGELLLDSTDNKSMSKALNNGAYEIGLLTNENVPSHRGLTPKETEEVIAYKDNSLSDKQTQFLEKYLIPNGDILHSARDYEQGLVGDEDIKAKELYEKVVPEGLPEHHRYSMFMPRPTLRNTPPKELAQNKLHNEMLEDIFPRDEAGSIIMIPADEREHKLEKWIRTFANPEYEMPENINEEDLVVSIGIQQYYINKAPKQEVSKNEEQPKNIKHEYVAAK